MSFFLQNMLRKKCKFHSRANFQNRFFSAKGRKGNDTEETVGASSPPGAANTGPEPPLLEL